MWPDFNTKFIGPFLQCVPRSGLVAPPVLSIRARTVGRLSQSERGRSNRPCWGQTGRFETPVTTILNQPSVNGSAINTGPFRRWSGWPVQPVTSLLCVEGAVCNSMSGLGAHGRGPSTDDRSREAGPNREHCVWRNASCVSLLPPCGLARSCLGDLAQPDVDSRVGPLLAARPADAQQAASTTSGDRALVCVFSSGTSNTEAQAPARIKKRRLRSVRAL